MATTQNSFSLDGVVRTAISITGSYLVGKNLFGITVDAVLWQEIAGVILVIGSIVWSIKTKTLTIEKFQGAMRQTVTFVTGVLATKGLITGEQALLFGGLGVSLSQPVYAYLSRLKSQHLDTGEIKIEQLKKQ